MRSHHSNPRIDKRHFWRDHNDDDNPTYPELRRPPRMGNADIDQTENPDAPSLNRKEAEDFDRLVVQAKKEKEEKLKKEKEEKEKKEKEAGGKKDDAKDAKDAKKSFSQTKHKKKHHHHHGSHHEQPNYNQGYVQLNQNMLMKQNSSTLFAKNATKNTNSNSTLAKISSPKIANATQNVQTGKNNTLSKKELH